MDARAAEGRDVKVIPSLYSWLLLCQDESRTPLVQKRWKWEAPIHQTPALPQSYCLEAGKNAAQTRKMPFSGFQLAWTLGYSWRFT